MSSSKQSSLTKFFCGGISAGLSKTVTAPAERLKIILQTKTGTGHPGVFNTVRTIISNEGVLSFWKGNGMNCTRIVPTYALRLCLFDRFKSKRRDRSLTSEMLAGSCSGAATAVVVFPLDLLRTRLSADTTHQYRGAIDLIKKTLNTQGIVGFYQGFWISILEITPYTAISLGGYAFVNKNIKRGEERNGIFQKLLTGYMCGMTASLFCYPMDTLKRRLMTSGYRVSALKCTQDIISNNGISGFYRGCLVNAMKSAPALAITLTTNDLLLDFLDRSGYRSIAFRKETC